MTSLKDYRELQVMSALVVRSPFDESVLPAYHRSGGVVSVEWAPTTVLLENIKSGARADVVIATVSAMDQLIAEGIVNSATRVELVDSKIGLAVKRGADHPDISTVEALVRTLTEARSVAYSIGGASGIHFQKVLSKLAIAEQVNAKATAIPQGFTAEQIIAGNADLAVQQVSELLVVDGIEVIGTLPEEVQSTTSFSAAAFADTPKLPEVEDFLRYLRSAEAVQAYQAKGLQLRR